MLVLNKLRHFRRLEGFNRIDLCVVIFMSTLLLTLAFKQSSKVRIASGTERCVSNLKLIGQGASFYSAQNSEKLPYAFLRRDDRNQISWDTLLSSFLYNASNEDQQLNSMPADQRHQSLMLCPEDTVPSVSWGNIRPKRRTYAMPWHNMYPQNWPPGWENSTGVGLWWAPYGGTNSNVNTVTNLTDALPSIGINTIFNTTNVMFATDMAQANNILGNSSGAIVKSTAGQLATNDIPKESYHNGRFNYLMVDGHVENLLPAQSVGHTGMAGERSETHRGIWTISPGD
jgi:prepilin-type processing-associated H-X9-DG protein